VALIAELIMFLRAFKPDRLRMLRRESIQVNHDITAGNAR
jgi:hypothetical protein